MTEVEFRLMQDVLTKILRAVCKHPQCRFEDREDWSGRPRRVTVCADCGTLIGFHS